MRLLRGQTLALATLHAGHWGSARLCLVGVLLNSYVGQSMMPTCLTAAGHNHWTATLVVGSALFARCVPVRGTAGVAVLVFLVLFGNGVNIVGHGMVEPIRAVRMVRVGTSSLLDS